MMTHQVRYGSATRGISQRSILVQKSALCDGCAPCPRADRPVFASGSIEIRIALDIVEKRDVLLDTVLLTAQASKGSVAFCRQGGRLGAGRTRAVFERIESWGILKGLRIRFKLPAGEGGLHAWPRLFRLIYASV
jgi:hypothetical protein